MHNNVKEESEDPPAFQESKRKKKEIWKRQEEDMKAESATKEVSYTMFYLN